MPGKGFATLVETNPDRQRELAAKGGRNAHAVGTAHEFTSEEGRVHGEKGGRILVETRGKDYMRSIGRKGGLAKRLRMKKARPEIIAESDSESL